ncbi:unnamed protein product [Meloidogyne enterolobii]|uniref:Uncharacterized protein n=1 Tax=Meloidogyne enterolobii TaxID=390850 RepID=A0ACB0YF03_MELEN
MPWHSIFQSPFKGVILLETGIQIESGILFFNHLSRWHFIRD